MYITHKPWPKQLDFLTLTQREAFYGGAAGGGKSDALLMGALQHVDVPGYSALILRRTYADLWKQGALIPRSHQWLASTAARWKGDLHKWEFPSGAVIEFGYLERDEHLAKYDSSEYQYIAFDEVTQFTKNQYTYMFSRNRRVEGQNATVPLRMRSASNPGGVGHEWVKERFVDAATRDPKRVFIPALMHDNPAINAAEYSCDLEELEPVRRAQLRDGDWDIRPESGSPYKRKWWYEPDTYVANRYLFDDERIRTHTIARCLSYDTAFSKNVDADYTACTVFDLLADRRLPVRHAWHDRLTFPELIARIRADCRRWNNDHKLRWIVIENKGSGISAIQQLKQDARLSHEPGMPGPEMFRPFTPVGDKAERGRRASTWCERGCVLLPIPSDRTPWLPDHEENLFGFPDLEHDDPYDSFTQGILFFENILAAGWKARQLGMAA